MKLTGIVFLVLGVLFLGYMVYDVFDPNGREEIVPFLSQTWASILGLFSLSAGIALLVASRSKYSHNRRERERVRT